MAKIVADISTSLDGYVTGPDASPALGLGRGGEPIHTWVFSGDPTDQAELDRQLAATGAVVMGRRLFDVVDGPDGWDESMGYGAAEGQASSGPPIFVVTHHPPSSWRLGSRFSFVTSLPDAVEAARAAAGDHDVIVMGGGDVVRQAVLSRLADELVIHLSPVLVGSGTPLFTPSDTPLPLRQTDVRVSPNATHLTYAIG